METLWLWDPADCGRAPRLTCGQAEEDRQNTLRPSHAMICCSIRYGEGADSWTKSQDVKDNASQGCEAGLLGDRARGRRHLIGVAALGGRPRHDKIESGVESHKTDGLDSRDKEKPTAAEWASRP
jgi:hypothetical protein